MSETRHLQALPRLTSFLHRFNKSASYRKRMISRPLYCAVDFAVKLL